MRKIVVEGGVPLRGQIEVSGAKNAVLPLMAATLLADGVSVIEDSPWLADVDTMCAVLASLGLSCTYEEGSLRINSSGLCHTEAPGELVRKMRASFLVMGPLLARCGRVRMSLPGGCAIGVRPIGLHLKGLEAMGAEVSIGDGYIEAKANRLKGNQIYLDFPSVGATENLMMAAALAEGNTVIGNAAQEPEIVDLSNMLSAMGARIKGAGTNIIRIKGVKALNPALHTVIPDRIEAGSFMVMAAATGGELIITNVITEHIKSVTAKLKEAAITVEEGYDGVHVIGAKKLLPVDVKTLPYPGFPTDMQAQFMALLTLAHGTSVITETVFENRFRHAEELCKMSADIKTEGNSAVINGIPRLHGATLTATDLRAGAAMIVAALAAQGITTIQGIHHIERGYENICGKLSKAGAKITLVEEADGLLRSPSFEF
ncbi:MAG: UDP-N-acetylglucosamine 1-carboxyvinyltransferase [Clostridiales bacterium]|nr:UDP-N-acetylglucosamine 1-carboxyvinyltransferase [Clostridiales bacterium]